MDDTLQQAYARTVERTCREILAHSDALTQKTVFDAMEYSLYSGGKRVRPFLTFAFFRACTGSDDMKPAEYYAAAIEMVHTFSLIHDDLPAMDDDDVRRGRPTNHIMFGEATAILAGDALLSEAFGAICRNSFCSDAQNTRAVRTLADETGALGMIGGQQIDIQSEGMSGVTRETLRELHTLKTACLIRCACKLGCIAADADASLVAAAEEYGNCLGLAFQIKDDLLDVEGDESELGKAVGKDLTVRKTTYPALYGVEQSRMALRSMTEKAEEAVGVFPHKPSIKILTEYAGSLMERRK